MAADLGALQTRLERLEAENRALREAAAHRRQTRYRRTAAGLLALGGLAVLAALALPGGRDVLLALGATGLFGGLLTYYLTPERFIAADVGDAAYRAYADTAEALVDELGLTDRRVYVPRGDGRAPVLFVPQHAEYTVPDAAALDRPVVVGDDPGARGLALRPTGGPLLRELRPALAGPLADAPATLADQLADGLVEAFELANGATPDVEADRATVAIAGPAFGDVDRLDHPIASLLGVGFAAGLDRPVAVETAAADDRADALVTCRFAVDDDTSPNP